jgi:hypothetical protein
VFLVGLLSRQIFKKCECCVVCAGKKIGEEINENDFVKMLSKRIQGKVTLTSEEMDEKSATYKSAGIMTKVSRKIWC